jgi:hypothetical protein
MTNRNGRRERVTRNLLVILGTLALMAGGCTSGPEPGSVRMSEPTAPADVQLACASAAATSFGVDSGSILPVSSSQLDGGRYQVELNVKGERANCIVDSAGNVQSVQKA